MTEKNDIEITQHDSYIEIVMMGEFRACDEPGINLQLAILVEQEEKNIILDLTQVTKITGVCLKTLYNVLAVIYEKNHTIILCDRNSKLAFLLDYLGFNNWLSIVDKEDTDILEEIMASETMPSDVETPDLETSDIQQNDSEDLVA